MQTSFPRPGAGILPQATEIRSGPETPGRDGVRFGLLSVFWCCCSFVGCSAVSLPSLVALLGPKICQSRPLPKDTKTVSNLASFLMVFSIGLGLFFKASFHSFLFFFGFSLIARPYDFTARSSEIMVSDFRSQL